MSNFGTGSPKEYSCIITLKSIHWLRQRSRLKIFLFLALVAILFNEAEQFQQFYLVEGYPRNMSVKLFYNMPIILAEEVV